MTIAPVDGTVMVEANLRFDVDGISASLTGSGQRLVFRTDEPRQLVQALVGTLGAKNGRRTLGRVSDALGAHGLELRVVGPQGVVARIGAGADSLLGQMVTGSRQVQIGRLSSTLPLVRLSVRQRNWLWLAGSVGGVTSAAWVFLRGRRSAR